MTIHDTFKKLRILTEQNIKILKGSLQGYMTIMLNLAPHKSSGKWNVCPSAVTCIEDCLLTAGRNKFGEAKSARLWRTKLLFENEPEFLARVEHEIKLFIGRARRKGYIPTVRMNGLSDLRWLAEHFANKFPEVQFYDYTKNAQPWKVKAENYHLTFSWDGTERNKQTARESLARGINVAVVFDTKKKKPLPTTFLGYPVIDGDESDLRFLDPAGVIVGLRAKGSAIKNKPAQFVVKVSDIDRLNLAESIIAA